MAVVGIASVAATRDPRPEPVPSPEPSAAALPGPGQPSSLPAGNLRVLTPAETERLLDYASALAACLSAGGIDADGPTIGRRTISLDAADPVGLARLVSLATACADRLGDPPAPSSLQAVDADTIVLSLPKQCLLDPKIEARPQGVETRATTTA